MTTQIAITLVITSLALARGAFGQVPSAADASPYVYEMPVRTDDGWEVANLREAGIDSTLMTDLVAAIREQRLPNLHSVLLIKNGKLVFEEYFEGTDERRGRALGVVRFDRTTLHDLRSVTKSVTSALVGITIGHSGKVSASDSVFAFFPEHADLRTESKERIAIQHLLTMTSGLEWDESTYPYTDPRNSETAMDESTSSVRFVLEQSVVSDPGSRFRYCGGCTMVLAGIIRSATGYNLDEYAEEVLFRPLGITEFEWLHHADGLPIAASGLRLRPRDVAKIGYLYVNEGRWRGKEIIPASWVTESTRPHVRLDSSAAYGYQWWVDFEGSGADRYPVFVARGNGGQRIYVVPRFRLVAVITAGNYNRPGGSRGSEQAFWRFVLQAATSRIGK